MFALEVLLVAGLTCLEGLEVHFHGRWHAVDAVALLDVLLELLEFLLEGLFKGFYSFDLAD